MPISRRRKRVASRLIELVDRLARDDDLTLVGAVEGGE